MDDKTEQRMNEAEIVMLRWMCEVKINNKIKNKIIRGSVGTALIVDKMRKSRLRCFNHVMN